MKGCHEMCTWHFKYENYKERVRLNKINLFEVIGRIHRGGSEGEDKEGDEVKAAGEEGHSLMRWDGIALKSRCSVGVIRWCWGKVARTAFSFKRFAGVMKSLQLVVFLDMQRSQPKKSARCEMHVNQRIKGFFVVLVRTTWGCSATHCVSH